jgi:prepilin-type N-terminal cleavage/methylation domain-containing protein
VQRGFSLVEVIVTAAIAVVLGTAMAALAHAFAGWSTTAAQTVRSQAILDRFTERWYAESATAWSIFTPALDVHGSSNADGHEFDIATADARRRPSYRAYCFDTAAQSLNEYVYGSPGTAPVAAESVANVSAFDAHTYPISALRDPSSPLHDALFDGATIADAAVAVGLGAEAMGGNQITRVHVASGGQDRVLLLASETAPSGFTIVLTYTPAP